MTKVSFLEAEAQAIGQPPVRPESPIAKRWRQDVTKGLTPQPWTVTVTPSAGTWTGDIVDYSVYTYMNRRVDLFLSIKGNTSLACASLTLPLPVDSQSSTDLRHFLANSGGTIVPCYAEFQPEEIILRRVDTLNFGATSQYISFSMAYLATTP